VETSIRLAELGDAEAIRTIYNVEVSDTTVTFDMVPRTLQQQEDWLREHAGGHPAIVAVDDAGTVVGFGSLTPYKERPAYSPTVEDSVYVHRSLRGHGIGQALLAELVRLAEGYGYHSIVARIVGGHDASISLHEAHGFELVGVEREVGRKLGRWLDVAIMQRML
jgi:L-amino acid N-acyltransferase YncA